MPLDIGVGLMLGVLLSSLTTLGYGWSLAIGVSATLMPDLDYIWKAIRTKKLPNSEHRDGLHYPLIIVPLAGIIGLVINPHVGLILALGTLIHFVHDSVGIGFGVKWLFPFKQNSYLFLFQIKTPKNKNMPKQRLYSWSDKERSEMIRKYAYPNWITYVYLHPNVYGLFEYSIFAIGVVIAILAS